MLFWKIKWTQSIQYDIFVVGKLKLVCLFAFKITLKIKIQMLPTLCGHSRSMQSLRACNKGKTTYFLLNSVTPLHLPSFWKLAKSSPKSLKLVLVRFGYVLRTFGVIIEWTDQHPTCHIWLTFWGSMLGWSPFKSAYKPFSFNLTHQNIFSNRFFFTLKKCG